jgi:hypothetical protein
MAIMRRCAIALLTATLACSGASAQQVRQFGQTLMLKCYGGQPENGTVRKGDYEMGMLVNFDTRLAFIGGWATLEMLEVVDNQVTLRSRDGKIIGGIDRITGTRLFVATTRTIRWSTTRNWTAGQRSRCFEVLSPGDDVDSRRNLQAASEEG